MSRVRNQTMIVTLKKLLKRFPRLYLCAQQLYPFITAVPFLLRGRRGGWGHLLSTWSLLRRSPVVAGLPMNITIEPTNLCNLRCPICETGIGKLGRPDRQMSLDEFRIIIGKVARHTNTLVFYFMGEPFLNREAYRMIRVAKEAGIPWVTTCTNGETVDPARLAASGIDEVSFQIGGMSPETHRVYRINGDLERVLGNLRETVRLRREQGIPLRIVCGMILMRHNEHEVELFRRTMAEIGVDEAAVIDPCVRTVAQGELYLPSNERHWYYDPQAFRAGELRPRVSPEDSCPWLYYSLTVHANGDVVPCCRDPKGDYVMGNLLDQGLREIWHGERYRAFRARLLRNQSLLDICRLCSGYPASALK
jgi:radical SAM protein with 4Fe4S-binding SPASM domain